MKQLRIALERNGFEVCSRLADKVGVNPQMIRLLFIYISFATVGILLPVYLIMALVFKVKDKLFIKRKSVFDL